MTQIDSKEDIINLIRELYVEAYIHASMDCEVTCAGNGVNPGDALSVYRGLAKQIGISTDKPTTEEITALENDPYYQERLEENGYTSLSEVI